MIFRVERLKFTPGFHAQSGSKRLLRRFTRTEAPDFNLGSRVRRHRKVKVQNNAQTTLGFCTQPAVRESCGSDDIARRFRQPVMTVLHICSHRSWNHFSWMDRSKKKDERLCAAVYINESGFSFSVRRSFSLLMLSW